MKNRFRVWHLPFLIVLIIATIYISRQEHGDAVPYQSEDGVIFGTIFHAKYQYKSSLKEEILEELNAVDRSLSMFNPQSTISQINAGESNQTDSLLNIVYLLSTSISEATEGAFDVTVAPLVNLWGFGFKKHQFPDSLQVDSVRELVGWQKVKIKDNTIWKENPASILDFSAIAKGFGADQVAAMFRRHGIQNFMIEIGGEVVAQGVNPKQETWKIGISKPSENTQNAPQELQEVIQLSNSAMATSGNYRNFYIHEGKKISHTINPISGYPAQQNILSSSVIAPSCAMADGYATAFMVMGLERAQAFLRNHPQLDAYFIYADEKGEYAIWHTDNFRKYMKTESRN